MKIFVTVGVLLILAFTWAVATEEQSQDIGKHEKAPAGHIVSIIAEPHWYGDISVVTLDDGTILRLSGIFNPWKAGDTITRTVPLKDGKDYIGAQYWCLGDTCLKQQ